MDQTQLQQQISLYYSRLSPAAQEVFAKMEWLETLKQLGDKYNLTDAQKQILGTETTLVLLGVISTMEYADILQNELGLIKETISKILLEINSTILDKVKTQIEEAYTNNLVAVKSDAEQKEKQLTDKWSRLPKEIQNAVKEINYQEKLYSLAARHKLTVSQMGILEQDTTNVITGMSRADQFEATLTKDITLDQNTIKELIKDINEEILKPIREKMMAINTNKINAADNEILKKSGIEIVDRNSTSSAPIVPPMTKSIEVAKVELPTSEVTKSTTSLSGQKFSMPVQNTMVKTEYTLNNLSKSAPTTLLTNPAAAPKNVLNIAPMPPKSTTPTSYTEKKDPYRLSPDE